GGRQVEREVPDPDGRPAHTVDDHHAVREVPYPVPGPRRSRYPGHDPPSGSSPSAVRSARGSETLHDPNPIHSRRPRPRPAATVSTTGWASVRDSRSVTSATAAPSAAARQAASTFTKPWWVKPVAGSVWRTAWCSPAVSLNGRSRSRQPQI